MKTDISERGRQKNWLHFIHELESESVAHTSITAVKNETQEHIHI